MKTRKLVENLNDLSKYEDKFWVIVIQFAVLFFLRYWFQAPKNWEYLECYWL